MVELVRMTAEEWRAKANTLNGGDMLDTPFVCPACGNIATPRQFQALGTRPGRAASECIGRVTGGKSALHSKGKTVPKPCDWAAFGLLGTLGRGYLVNDEEGNELQVFAFAEPI